MKLPINYNTATPFQRKQAREQYKKEQNFKCAHCGEDLDKKPSLLVLNSKIRWSLFPVYFQKYPIHLHHNHKTGMTIGAVHMRCNAWLWIYKGE